MGCPTCDHTMQKINVAGSASGWFWCPRCGSIRGLQPDGMVIADAPKLVERCRRYELGLHSDQLRRWQAHSIDESINLPADRGPS